MTYTTANEALGWDLACVRRSTDASLEQYEVSVSFSLQQFARACSWNCWNVASPAGPAADTTSAKLVE